MNTRPTLQTKRKAPGKSGFRVLRAATRRNSRRKQRAATTAAPEDLGEVPGVGVARALVVIMLLHVAAIAGIYLHNKWNSSPDLKASIPEADARKPLPTIVPGGKTALVNYGDNYATLAREYNVDEEALRRANDYAELKSGLKINIPNSNRRIESTTPSESMAGVIGESHPPAREAMVEKEVVPHTEFPPIQPNDTETLPKTIPGTLVEVNKPMLIQPLTPRVKPVSTQVAAPPAASGSYTVKSGDSMYRIAKNHRVSLKDLLTINNMEESSLLKIGKVLRIPVAH